MSAGREVNIRAHDRVEDPVGIEPAIAIRAPVEQTAPLVFASPHSGSAYDPTFLAASKLDRLSLRRSEDSFVDEIFAHAPAHGAPLLCALYPRAYLDPNREAYELDPEMFVDALPSFVKTRSERVRAGFGTVARLVASGAEIYRDKLRFADAEARIQGFYVPYHEALQRLLADTRARFGFAILFDCHSMPSVGGPTDRDRGKTRTDFVLGDRYGSSCAPALTRRAETVLRDLGFTVARNDPYAGAHTTTHYGRPRDGVHALQIEVNRALYMDEERFARSHALGRLTDRIGDFISALAKIEATSLQAP